MTTWKYFLTVLFLGGLLSFFSVEAFAETPKILRVTAIPDEAPTELHRKIPRKTAWNESEIYPGSELCGYGRGTCS